MRCKNQRSLARALCLLSVRREADEVVLLVGEVSQEASDLIRLDLNQNKGKEELKGRKHTQGRRARPESGPRSELHPGVLRVRDLSQKVMPRPVAEHLQAGTHQGEPVQCGRQSAKGAGNGPREGPTNSR